MRGLTYVGIILTAGLAFAQAPTTMKYGVPVKAGPMDSVLLKDYEPESSVVVPANKLSKPRFPVTDVHTHDSMSGIKTAADVARWVKTMDETGVAISVVFTEETGEEFARIAKLFLAYPDRFQV
ncbi:MAG: hypothetical protein NTY38_07035, partial [Acidobacteria bacterium]|nr:hypothetical protein [Acidobacteriota bacterium]